MVTLAGSSAETTFLETMPEFGLVMAARRATFAPLSLKTTVVASGASMASMPVKEERAAAAVFSSRMRSKVNFTSSAVSTSPLWNLTLGRSLTVRVLPSSLHAHDSARFGTTFRSWSNASSGS